MSSTPTCIQARMTPNMTSNANVSVWKQRFCRPTGAGNLGWIAFQWGSSAGTITSVVDDQGNSWHSFTAVADAGNNQSAQIWYLQNMTANTKQVTVTLSSAFAFTSILGPYEFNAVDTSATPTDGSAGRTTSGTALSSGSFTSGQQDLIIQAVFLDSFTAPATRMTWTANAGYTLLTPDGYTFSCAQWSVQAAGAQNPALTSSLTATSAISLTAAFKVSSGAGTDRPAGIGANRVACQIFPGYMSAIVDASSWTFQFPTEGNLIVVGSQTKALTISSISSSPANTWVACGTPAIDTVSTHRVEFWYAKNASPSETMTITITFTSATGGTANSAPEIYLVDITGADISSPVAQTANFNGQTTAVSGNVAGATLSSVPANGLVLGYRQEDGETVTAMAGPSGALILTPDVGVYGLDGAEKDAGFFAYYPTTSAGIQANYTYSNYESSTQINAYVDQLVAFQGPGVPGILQIARQIYVMP